MRVPATITRDERALLRTLITLSAILLVGLCAWAPRACAQTTSDNTTAKSDRSDTGDGKSQSSFNLGDDTIDPNQPLKPDFLISVSVVGEPDPSGNYAVDEAGNVSIKYAGIMTPIRVSGLTPVQAQNAIADYLKTYIKNPQVKVTIINVPHPQVFVAGAVRNTGLFTISKDSTLADILSRAQWSDVADLTQVRVTSTNKVGDREEKVTKTYEFDHYVQVTGNNVPDDAQNPVLHDKDKIFVPFKTLPGGGTVSVYGEVGKPQRELALPSGQTLTVREAINLVGGTLPNANRKAVVITRPSLDRPLIIDLDKAEQGDPVYNIALKADDSIYVEKLQDNAYINVNGGFVKPGKYVYDKRTTLTQAVMEAGGAAPFAKIKNGVIYRHPDNDPKHSRVIKFNWDEIQNGKSPDLELQPGDSVWISPGTQPRPPLDVFQVLGGLGSAAYIYNTFSGRWIP